MQVDPAEARLGQWLFYDPILSGNRNISCATCHNHTTASADGLSLGIGEGGKGVGPARVQGTARQRQSRNAPGLWNLGAVSVTSLFHDGRVFQDESGRLHSPAGAALPSGLSGVLAAQALFPMIARTEMAGDPGENPVATAAERDASRAWALIAARVAQIPDYAHAFDALDPGRDITISRIANAIAAFVASEWRATDTGFDRYLRGQSDALTPDQRAGMELFFGAAGCADCHAGTLLSDGGYHGLGLPQFGPGQTRQFDPVARDVGRMAVTNDQADAYRFRTPMLRNVRLTGPYGHNGTYARLDQMIRHHADPAATLARWRPDQLNLPEMTGNGPADFPLLDDALENRRIAASRSPLLRPVTEEQIALLVAFLDSLTDADALKGRLGKPTSVPSGLPID